MTTKADIDGDTGIPLRLIGQSVAVFLIVLLPFLLNQRIVDSALVATARVTHSAQVKSASLALAHELRTTEAAVYMRILGLDRANDARRLQRDPQALLAEEIGKLRTLAIDNPTQQARINRLESLASGRLVMLERASQQATTGAIADAIVTIGDANRLFPWYGMVDEIVRAQEQAQAELATQAAHTEAQARAARLLAAVLQLILLALVLLLSERQHRRRRDAEAEARTARARSLEILQTVREPIALLDAQLGIVMRNTAFGELYGDDGEDPSAEGRQLAAIANGAWNDAGLMQRLGDVARHDRELWDYELRQTFGDGSVRTMLVNARRMRAQDMRQPLILLTAADVSARQRTEQQILELNRQLIGKVAQVSESNRELEAFSYSVSHDLRAPLRHVSAFADKLGRHLGDTRDDKTAHYLGVIASAAQRMSQLIDDLLVYSRLGRGAMRTVPLDMQSVVADIRGMLRPESAGRNVVWKIGDLPVVAADENMIRLVWQNLLGNALKYTSQREVAVIEVSATRDADDGEYVFCVSDNGAGFDNTYVDKLFGVFQRLHKPDEFPGTGIGLANVRRIVTRHGGRVWAEGAPDAGARFFFTLPAAAAATGHESTT